VTSSRNPHLVVTVKCAVPGCTNVRREANHWFITSVCDGRFFCGPYLPATGLSPIDEPACGQACAQKLLERYLALINLGTPSPANRTHQPAPLESKNAR